VNLVWPDDWSEGLYFQGQLKALFPALFGGVLPSLFSTSLVPICWVLKQQEQEQKKEQEQEQKQEQEQEQQEQEQQEQEQQEQEQQEQPKGFV
jgi:flagellar biosynthesis component FlhA